MDDQLMEELAELPGWDSLASAGAVAAADPGVIAKVQAEVREAAEREKLRVARARRRRRLPAAILVAAAAIAGVLVLVQGREPREQPTAGPASTSASTPRPSAASCVEGYSLTNLAHRSLAFDGSVERVVAIDEPANARIGRAQVTFVVNRWFRGGSGGRVTVVTSGSSDLPEDQQPFRTGTRLLVSGETQRGAGSIAWTGCGFTRPYDRSTATDWQSVFKK